MQNEQTTFISLMMYSNQPMPYILDVVKETEKAYELKNQCNKSIWLPKSVITFDDNLRVFKMATWFRKKLTNIQISIIQG